MSATAHAVLSLLVGAATAPAGPPPPPPRLVASPGGVATPLPPQPRPLAVVTLGVGMLALAGGLSLVVIGTESRVIASDGRTEGEVRARDRGARHLLAVGIPLASAGMAVVIGGIVWVVRSRARRRHTASSRDSAASRSVASRSPISMVASSRSGRV